MSEYELVQKRGHGSRTLLKADSLEDIGEFVAAKSGDIDIPEENDES